MEKNTQLSVIIPTMGRSTLQWVVDHVLASVDDTHIDCEIILVFNGGSTDKGLFDLEKYSRVKKVFKKEFGVSAARNVGLDIATGDILAFIGDDTAPDLDWAARVMKFHRSHPEKESVLLGMVDWTASLKHDRFHDFLLGFGQFDFPALQKGRLPTWKHFYTSNISGKRSFFDTERFSEAFLGWGFEDSEYGYRLSLRGMRMYFDANVRVEHDHPQTLRGVIKNIQSAKKNALQFEQMHPGVRLRPRFFRWWFLFFVLLCVSPFALISRPVYWWWRIKLAWL